MNDSLFPAPHHTNAENHRTPRSLTVINSLAFDIAVMVGALATWMWLS